MLRKKNLLMAAVVMLCSIFTSQAQVYEDSKLLFDVYYGGPNLFTGIIKTAYQGVSDYTGVKISSIGPIGAKAEYLLSKRIGIGVNVNYANSSVEAMYASNDGKTYEYSAKMPRLRVFPTVNFHLGNSERFDPYFSVGAGYSSFKVDVKTNAPDAESVNFKMPGSFAMRGEFGMRYFFTDNIGAHVQFGIGGGPLVAGGLSLKF